MSGTRFARTGRCRFVVCLGILVLMVGMVAIFHSSQVQLDETREQRLHCEQQQEALNERLTSLVEQKYHLERNQERERSEQLENKRKLEQNIKDLEEKYQRAQVEQQMLYDKLKQTYTLLESDHNHLKEQTKITNKQQLDSINSLEKKLQSIKSELQKEKTNNSGELLECKEKYDIAEQENKRLHDLISADNLQMHDRIKELEGIIKNYQSHCEYKEVNRPLKLVGPKPGIDNTSTSEKSFRQQELMVPKPIKGIFDDGLQQQQEKPNRQLSQESDKNQVAPLSAPKNKGQWVFTPTAKSQQLMQAIAAGNTTAANVRTARKSNANSSSSQPLASPPNQRKLPENVAPIPDNFEDLFQKSNNYALKSNDEQSPLEENINYLNNNKNDSPLKSVMNNNINNYEPDAHEVKAAFRDRNSNNMQHDDDINNFFDTDSKINKNKNLNDDKYDDDGNDNDEGGLGGDNDGGESVLGGAAAGDIAVKHNQQQQLLDNSLKNEVADDQGKEFGDGLRLDEVAMEEDDDDEYSHLSVRKQAGGQAIRN